MDGIRVLAVAIGVSQCMCNGLEGLGGRSPGIQVGAGRTDINILVDHGVYALQDIKFKGFFRVGKVIVRLDHGEFIQVDGEFVSAIQVRTDWCRVSVDITPLIHIVAKAYPHFGTTWASSLSFVPMNMIAASGAMVRTASAMAIAGYRCPPVPPPAKSTRGAIAQ